MKDALTLLSTVRSRYTKQFTLELAGQDISQHNWNLIIEGSEMWTSSRLGTWWVVSWHGGLKNGMPNVISDILFTQIAPVGATKGQRGRNRKRRTGMGHWTGLIWDSTEQSIPVFS